MFATANKCEHRILTAQVCLYCHKQNLKGYKAGIIHTFGWLVCVTEIVEQTASIASTVFDALHWNLAHLMNTMCSDSQNFFT